MYIISLREKVSILNNFSEYPMLYNTISSNFIRMKRTSEYL